MKSFLLLSLGLFTLSHSAAACTAPPPVVIDIDANGYYTDSHHSVIDPVLRARNIANTRPIEDFLADVATNASRYQADPAGKAADGACALTWLDSWAGQRALLGKMSSEQAFYQRKWTLAGLALSYARVRPLASAGQQQAIEGWLSRLADATIAHSDAHKGARNNHYYWEGLAVTAVGGITREPRHLSWGRKVFDDAMAQVAPDGSLPREMERGSKALHYHIFSVEPLTVMASILDLHSPALDRLARFTLAAAADPSALDKATGFAQEKAGAMWWPLVYARHEGRAEWAAGIPPARPQARLGGDLNLANPLEHVAGTAVKTAAQ